MSKILWTRADEAIANAEGWCMSNDADASRWELQRLDDRAEQKIAPFFDSDLSANAYVTCRALEGSDLHRRAITLDGEIMLDDAP